MTAFSGITVCRTAISFLAAISLSQGAPDFSEEILPLLSENCFQCHGPDQAERKAGLRLDTFEGATRLSAGRRAVSPGDPQSSELIRRILAADPEERMPPRHSNLSLTASDKRLLEEWIKNGAAYEEHWAFIPPQRPDVPPGEDHPIDAFVGRRLAEEGLTFAPEARPERLIRRLSLDLTGLPPTPEEVTAFTEAYGREGDVAYERWVDRMLASPRYGETMALPWLDAARFADTDGYQYDGPRFMWRWRDWVINAYNSKMPFDQFTIEQLAGDLLPNATLEQRMATGFNRNHRYNSESGLVVEEFLLENAVDRVDTTATLWLGLTMGCARCHDHKYDPISQRDYYQLIAFFNSVPEAGRAIKSTNSEPVMLAPTRLQQSELAKRRRAVDEARQAIEPDSRVSVATGPLIDRKLVHRFHAGEPLVLDGNAPHIHRDLDENLSMRANQSFTISLWLRPNRLDDVIILSRQQPGNTRPGIELSFIEGGRLRFDLITRWVAGTGRVVTRDRLREGDWVHVTISNDGSQSANGQHVYLNGQRVKTDTSYNTNSNVGGVKAAQPLRLGGGVRPGGQGFAGAMRDVRLYQTRLWPEEIAVLAASEHTSTKETFARIKDTSAYAHYVKKREGLEAYEKTLPTLMIMKEAETPKPTFIRHRGVYHDHREQVERDVPHSLPPLKKDAPRNRLGFAQWLVSPEHPLTARVAVNRYWQRYFGKGLVKTSEDFGIQGEKPSHPELLDWLATEFIASGWNVAAMQKRIVTSRTYRQRSHVHAELAAKDPDNRLLARGPRLRLSAHGIRDQALFAAGLLVERNGGPSVSPYQPQNLWAEMSMGMKYKQSKGPALYRRSLYTIWKRTVAPPAMAVFDAADREACWVKRKETNTPLQALTLLNETGYVESARHLAVRMLIEGEADPLGYGFQLLTSRSPHSEERQILTHALESYRRHFSNNPEACQALLAVGDSPANTSLPQAELAAHTALANMLLNLDEVITKE